MPAIPAIGAIAGLASTAGQISGQQSQARSQKKAAKRAAAAQKRAMELARQDFLEAQKSIGQLTEAELPEIQAMREAAGKGLTKAQTEQAKQTALQLSRGGVKGGRAGIISATSAGELGEALQEQIDKYALEDAVRRYGTKGAFFGQKGQIAQPVSYGG